MLIVNCEYGRCNGENLRLPIEIQLSSKPQSFCYLFFAFWYLYEISNVLKKKKKKNERHNSSISEITDSKIWAYLNA